MSQNILEHTIASEETPGTKMFPPFAPDDELNEKAARWISHYPEDQKRSAVLMLLHDVQHKFGYISAPAIDWVAEKLDIEPIKVVEVVTFYPGLRQNAPGKFHIRVCRTLSCAMAGSYELMEKFCDLAQIDRSQTSHHNPIAVSPCGNYSVEFAECLASCGTGPVCMVNDDFHESVTADKAVDLLAKYPKES
ncbi:MAG: NAD(P)H-dependent oxidoreductase subunit E [Verrucomicrobiota bacterium JB023]|nr:NAD(P)H-dependent oxidoreductase subunit E [Verrucomicrobiota bacterium JB023]